MNFNDFLESGHRYSKEEQSLKFRIRLINFIMLVIVITSSAFAFMHYLHVSPLNNFHANINLIYAASNLLFIVILRKNRESYEYLVYLMIFTSLVTFTSALITVTNDEFRVMWFYILILLSFFTGGLITGYITAIVSAAIVLIAYNSVDLHLSNLSIVTALVGMFIITLSVKVYTKKMIDTENALLLANASLNEKVENAIEDIRQKDKLMLQQARLAQMGELIAMIAHQWRQPLSSIAAISTNLKLSIALGDEISKESLESELSSIEERVSLLSRTIDDFRNFYQHSQNKHDFFLKEVIAQSLDVLTPFARNIGISINTNLYFTQAIHSFESEIIQVLMNIIKNAMDILKEKEGYKEITIKGYEDLKYAYILIEDNAGGVCEESLDKIFEPYYSTKLEKNGTGLGLYMSKLIIDEHCHGELSVSNSSAGAVFTIKLPLK